MTHTSERSAVQPQLDAYADLFRAAFEHSLTSRALLSAEGTILCANSTFARCMGLPADGLVGRALADLVHVDDRDRVAAIGATGLRSLDARIPKHDGTECVVEIGTHALTHSTGGAPFLAVELIDASTRIDALSKLRDSETRLSLALDGSKIGLWDWHLTDGSLYFNDTCAVMVGYDADELSQTFASFRERVHPADKPALTETLSRHLRGNDETFRLELRLRRKDETLVWVDLRGRIVERDASGTPLRMVGTLSDSSARRQAEAEQRALQSQMLRAQKLESLGVLAGGIAHDFNNLLTTILGNANLARALVGEESEITELLHDVELGAVRAAELTRQLLAYAGKGRFMLESIDLSAFLHAMKPLLHTAVSRRAKVELQLTEPLLAINADTNQMRQMVINLVTNASDAIGDADGTITIRTGIVRQFSRPDNGEVTSLPDHFVYLDVEDTGCGMNEQTLSRMFEPFFSTKIGGRGLGLSATRGIVQGHQGKLHVRSAPLAGTCIRMLFPVSHEVAAQSCDTVSNADAWRSSGTVLVVDDEEGVRGVASRLLARLGFDILTAKDGIEALEVYDAQPGRVRAVLLDLTMPRMGGAETLAELRRRNPQLPVVVTSGYSESELGVPVANQAAVGFLQKPFARSVLVRALREALGG